jgi:membrane protein required for colicin V production
METIDIIICIVLLYGLIKGLFKGFFVEIASLLALVLGVYGAVYFSHYIGSLLSDYLSWNEKYIEISAFALTFIAIVFSISLAGKLLTKAADFALLGWLNKLLGGVFGLLKVGLILSIILYFFSLVNGKFEFIDSDVLQASILYSPLIELVEQMYPLVSSGSLFEQTI